MRSPGSGVAAAGRAPFDLHQADFDIDESALAIGVGYTVELALIASAGLGAR